MTDQSVKKSSWLGSLGIFSPVVKMLALGVTILGAIPTAVNAYYAWEYKIPFSEVSYRLEQLDLWQRNFACKIDYKPMSTAQDIRVDAGVCPKTRDIVLRVASTDGKEANQWIAYDQLHKPGEKPPQDFLDLFFGVANAQEHAATGTQLAQGTFEVVCQSLVSSTELVRVVQENGKCFRETLSIVRGTVDKREEVPCNTQCPPSAS